MLSVQGLGVREIAVSGALGRPVHR
nr:hypothetical protein [Paraburkholderia sp. RAU2J]